MSTLKRLQQSMREHLSDSHERRCMLRQVSCDCGYEQKTTQFIKQAANRIDDLEDEVASLKATIKGV